jgi:hypothetical protein
MKNWNNWVGNSDSIKLISIKEIGYIQNEENKKKYIELLTADTSWVAHPAMGKKVFIDLLRYDSVKGKDINFYYSDRKLSKSYRTFQTKEYTVSYLNTYVLLTDKYYEIDFQINGRRITTPAICRAEKYLCRSFLNNILSELTIIR